MFPRNDYAEIALYVTATVEIFIWIAAFEYIRITKLRRKERREAAFETFALAEMPPGEVFSGDLELKGDARALAAKLTSQLAKDGLGPLGPVLIREADDRHVVFESAGRSSGNAARGFPSLDAQVWFQHGKPGLADVKYLLMFSKSDKLLIAARVVQVLGLAVVVGLFWFLRSQVLEHPNPAIRAQVFQMIQAIHILWPPFLLVGLSRNATVAVRSKVEAMIGNLPYL